MIRFSRQSQVWQPHWFLPNIEPCQERLGGRIALVAEINVAGSKFVTYNLHLESRGSDALRISPVRSQFLALPLAAGKEAPATEAYLNFENIVGTGTPPIYDVYINLPEGEKDPSVFYAGSLPMFGVAASSVANVHQSGSGTHYVLHVTELLDELRARKDWNESQLRVTLVPRDSLPPGARVSIGRVSLYVKQIGG